MRKQLQVNHLRCQTHQSILHMQLEVTLDNQVTMKMKEDFTLMNGKYQLQSSSQEIVSHFQEDLSSVWSQCQVSLQHLQEAKTFSLKKVHGIYRDHLDNKKLVHHICHLTLLKEPLHTNQRLRN